MTSVPKKLREHLVNELKGRLERRIRTGSITSITIVNSTKADIVAPERVNGSDVLVPTTRGSDSSYRDSG